MANSGALSFTSKTLMNTGTRLLCFGLSEMIKPERTEILFSLATDPVQEKKRTDLGPHCLNSFLIHYILLIPVEWIMGWIRQNHALSPHWFCVSYTVKIGWDFKVCKFLFWTFQVWLWMYVSYIYIHTYKPNDGIKLNPCISLTDTVWW